MLFDVPLDYTHHEGLIDAQTAQMRDIQSIFWQIQQSADASSTPPSGCAVSQNTGMSSSYKTDSNKPTCCSASSAVSVISAQSRLEMKRVVATFLRNASAIRRMSSGIHIHRLRRSILCTLPLDIVGSTSRAIRQQ